VDLACNSCSLSVYLQHVREEERTRIAREVHDELGQALTSCKMDLSWLAGRLPKNQRPLIDKARALTAHMDSTIRTVRRIATELRPGILDHLGLGAALEWQANEFQTRTGIRCEVRIDLAELTLPAETSTSFFRIFQETLTNIIRHAGATHVAVHLKEEGERIIMDVKDNGRGISEGEIANPKSLGLLGMKERAALLGGEFKIAGARQGNGTRVTVAIPLRHSPPEEKHDENPTNRRSRSRAARVETNSRR